MEITHFSHDHSLVLSDQKNGQVSCSGCMLPITGPAYVCANCKYYIHKSCGELEERIKHPFHPPHELSLLTKKPDHGFFCHVCKSNSSGFSYECCECSFNLDINCFSLIATTPEGIQGQTIKHFSHDHHLTPLQIDSKTCKVKCSGCEGILAESTYACPQCLFFLCKTCVEAAENIEHPSHPQHPLNFLLCSPDGDPVFCGVCLEKHCGLVYHCAECHFYIGLKCASLPNVKCEGHEHALVFMDKDSDFMCQSCSKLCSGSFLRCVLCDLSLHAKCIEKLPCAGIQEQKIKHFSHEHHLTPVQIQHSVIPFDGRTSVFLCCGCDGIFGDSSYVCLQCLFFLCKSCVDTPKNIEHPFHPQHQLTFLPRSPDGVPVFCNVCCEVHFGLVYHCAMCKFYIGIKCVSLPTVRYEGHEHPLVFMNKDSDYECKSCSEFCRRSFLRCVLCDLSQHVKCIEALPRAVKVKIHKHLLTLTDPLPVDGSDKYYCSYCEKERNPKYSFYSCAQCEAFAAHIKCGLSEMLTSFKEESSAGEGSVLRQLVDAGFDDLGYYSSDEPASTNDGVMFYTIILKQLIIGYRQGGKAHEEQDNIDKFFGAM